MPYKVVVIKQAQEDIKAKKKYILNHFKYREYANNFARQVKKAISALDTFPLGYNTTGFKYRGYDIYLKPTQGNVHIMV